MASTERKDRYCWICHRDGKGTISCSLCTKTFHLRCLTIDGQPPSPWVCSECETIMRAECLDSRNTAMRHVSVEQLCKIFRRVIQLMKEVPNSEPFHEPVDLQEIPNYLDFVMNPMDLKTLRSNVENKFYGSTDAFLTDCKWIFHNCVVFNGPSSGLTQVARSMLKACKMELQEIENCPSCYWNAVEQPNEFWFCEVCPVRHPLVWAKMKGYPVWPAKVLREAPGMLDCRFFGAHDRAWVPVSSVQMLSDECPQQIKTYKKDFEGATSELKLHIQKYVERFGSFQFATPNTPYTSGAQAAAPKHRATPSSGASAPKRRCEAPVAAEANSWSPPGALDRQLLSELTSQSLVDKLMNKIAAHPPAASPSGARHDALHSPQPLLDAPTSPHNTLHDAPASPDQSAAPSVLNTVDRLGQHLRHSQMVLQRLHAPADSAAPAIPPPTVTGADEARRSPPLRLADSLIEKLEGKLGDLSADDDETSSDALTIADVDAVDGDASEPAGDGVDVDAVAKDTASACSPAPGAAAGNAATSVTASPEQRPAASLSLPPSASSTDTTSRAAPQSSTDGVAQNAQSNPTLSPPIVALPETSTVQSTASAAVLPTPMSPDCGTSSEVAVSCTPKESIVCIATSPPRQPIKQEPAAEAAPMDVEAASSEPLEVVNAGSSTAEAASTVDAEHNSMPLMSSSDSQRAKPASGVSWAGAGEARLASKSSAGSNEASEQRWPERSGQSLSVGRRSETESSGAWHASGRRTRAQAAANGSDSEPDAAAPADHADLMARFTERVAAAARDALAQALAQLPAAPPPSSPTLETPQRHRPALGAEDIFVQSIKETQKYYDEQLHKKDALVERITEQFKLSLQKCVWMHRQQVEELRHNLMVTIYEIRKCQDLERMRLTEEQAKALEMVTQQYAARASDEQARHQQQMDDTVRQMETEKESAVMEAKKKQWCANCWREAIFYCCWNASYCDYPCQQQHWPHHVNDCLQRADAAQPTDDNQPPVADVSLPPPRAVGSFAANPLPIPLPVGPPPPAP